MLRLPLALLAACTGAQLDAGIGPARVTVAAGFGGMIWNAVFVFCAGGAWPRPDLRRDGGGGGGRDTPAGGVGPPCVATLHA